MRCAWAQNVKWINSLEFQKQHVWVVLWYTNVSPFSHRHPYSNVLFFSMWARPSLSSVNVESKQIASSKYSISIHLCSNACSVLCHSRPQCSSFPLILLTFQRLLSCCWFEISWKSTMLNNDLSICSLSTAFSFSTSNDAISS